ncbi:hypothetical protein ACIQH0_37685 [Streptomyces griseus]
MRITITDTSGTVTETTTADPTVAREYESLPFEADHIAVVTVTDDD